MSGEVDHYDVQSAQETAERNARYYTDRQVSQAVSEIHRAINDLENRLREDIADALINKGTLA